MYFITRLVFCVMKRKIKYAPATVESTNQPSMNYCNAIDTRRSFTHTHTVFSFEWILFSRRFDLLTIKQIESTNQAINSYKQHNKLKHWHYVSNGLVKCLCGGRGTNWRKIFWYDLAGFFFFFFSIESSCLFFHSGYSPCLSRSDFISLPMNVFSSRNTHRVSSGSQ